ncbi:four-helix bundle copper-binding protein [Benzoatithermus flavus]|uniref:Four-helix bundle copper-binding protein n=1 Tax=Benzoatithermus flavus TaxID=3108223 RepID=A0ABU8XRB2_9PROT
MLTISPDMRGCIEECLRCYQVCLTEASQHCLEAGGKHVEPAHLRLMLACAEACRASAHVMLLGVPEHKHSCAACAALCEACTRSCEQVGEMQECVEACRACAESCRRMAA